jgi:GMP synthase (glutamine-hydrolysing)
MLQLRLLIVKTGSALASIQPLYGDFEHWIIAGCSDRGIDHLCAEVVNVEAGQALGDPSSYDAAIISGSTALVTERLPWSERTAEWLRQAQQAQLPLLGICYGHQLLAHALGGTVEDNPAGLQFGTVSLSLEQAAFDDPLFAAEARKSHPFLAHCSHSQVVTGLPPNAVHLAKTPKDAYCAFRLGRAWGVQFHPEYDEAITRGYVEDYRERLQQQGDDVDALLAAIEKTPRAASILRRFYTYALAIKQGNEA